MSRYDPQHTTREYWVTDVAFSPSGPKVGKITAGVRLDTMLVKDGAEGFTAEPSYVDVTDLASAREKKVPGLQTTTDGSMTFFRGNVAADAEADLFDDLVEGTEGWVVSVLAGAPAIAGLCDIFPARIAAKNPMPPKGAEAGKFTVAFAIDGDFTLNKAIIADS